MAAGEVKATLFDEAVLETLADSLLPLTEEQQQRLPQHLAAAARAAAAGGGLQQLREYALSTFVRRYLNRSHLRHVSNERAAVNSVRFLEVGGCLALIVCAKIVLSWWSYAGGFALVAECCASFDHASLAAAARAAGAAGIASAQHSGSGGGSGAPALAAAGRAVAP